MALSGQVRTETAAMAGVLESTVDRMLRDLRAANMAPKGVPGRGTTEGNYGPYHYACLALAFAGHQPSDAAVAAETLSKFQYLTDYNPRDPQSLPRRVPRAPGNLGQVLEHTILGGWSFHEGKPTPHESPNGPYPPSLCASLNPPFAELIWLGADNLPDIIERYGPVGENSFVNGAVHRVTVVDSKLFGLFARLWRETNKGVEIPGRTSTPSADRKPIDEAARPAPTLIRGLPISNPEKKP